MGIFKFGGMMREYIKKLSAIVAVGIILLLLATTIYVAMFVNNTNLLMLCIISDILFPLFLYVFLNVAKVFKK